MSPNPMKFTCFGAMDVAKPHKFITPRMSPNPLKFICFGAMDVTKPYKLICFVATYVTKPCIYIYISFGAMDVTKPYKIYMVW